MVLHPETGSDPPIGSARDSGRDSVIFASGKNFVRNFFPKSFHEVMESGG